MLARLRKILKTLFHKQSVKKQEEKNVIREIAPIINLINNHEIERTEIEIAKLTIKICNEVVNNITTPRLGNLYFYYLWENIDLDKTPLRKEIQDLIISGNTIHDFGTEFGPDCNKMILVANKILNKLI